MRDFIVIFIFIFFINKQSYSQELKKSYFGGDYVGCDDASGLGMPDFKLLAKAYGLKYEKLKPSDAQNLSKLQKIIDREGAAIIVVPVDPEQTYFPKIASKITKNGSMESAPIHLMSPNVDQSKYEKYFKFI